MNTPPLRVKNLLKQFGGVRALDFQHQEEVIFHPGKVTAVLGGNGAGKTTLLNILNGVLKPERGTVLLGEEVITDTPPWKRCRMGMARLWQDLRLFPELNCIENVQVAISGQRGESAWLALSARRLIGNEELETRTRATACLERVGLGSVANHLACDISYGQQKLLAMARVICNDNVRFALLDEPIAGLDKKMLESVTHLIQNMRAHGIAVVLIEHDLLAIRPWVDFAVVLDEGKIAVQDSIEELLRIQKVRQLYMGIR